MQAGYARAGREEQQGDVADEAGHDGDNSAINEHVGLLGKGGPSRSIAQSGTKGGLPDMDEVSTAVEKEGKASLLSCVSNLANTILGTGMLAMPHSIASCGVIPGMALVIISGFLSFYGLFLLSRAASLVRPRRTASFAALSEMTFPNAAFIFDAAIAIKCAGVSTSYLIIIGGLMPKVILSFDRNPPEWILDRGLWIVAAMAILTPLCYLRQLNSLRFTSYIALVAVFDLVVVVVYKYFYQHSLPASSPTHLFVLHTSVISSIPVYIFAFTCAQNLFSCFNELARNTQKRMNIVTGTSIGSAAIIYEIIGVLGYLTFGEKVPSNIMQAYHDSAFINICRAGIVVLVLFSYPLQILPCRASLTNLFRGPDTPTKHVVLTTLLLLITFLIAMEVSSLELVLGIIGSTGSTTISFILPAVFYLKLFKSTTYAEEQGLEEHERVEDFKGARTLAKILLSVGVVVMFVCLGVVIYHAVVPGAAR